MWMIIRNVFSGVESICRHAERDGQEALSRPTILISGHHGVECG
jgi:hypothetical protein